MLFFISRSQISKCGYIKWTSHYQNYFYALRYHQYLLRICFHSKFLLPFLPFDSVSIMYASFIDLFFSIHWTLFERHYPKKDTSGFRWSRVCFLNIFVVFFRLHFVEIISNLHGKMTFVFHHFSNHLVQMITNFFWCSLNLSFGKCNAIH